MTEFRSLQVLELRDEISELRSQLQRERSKKRFVEDAKRVFKENLRAGNTIKTLERRVARLQKKVELQAYLLGLVGGRK